jgi:hypothetical protein
MKAQTPATGIMKINDWGKAKTYRISCGCSSPECDHNLWVEADDVGVNVTIYTNVKSKWWSINRWQKMWTLLTKGYVEYEADLIMNEQQALNYAETLKKAVNDVKSFKKS